MARDEPRISRAYVPTFNGEARTEVRYVGAPRDNWRDLYHRLLTMPLALFLAVMAGVYLATNIVFAAIYVMIGGVTGVRPGDFTDAFFFSVEVISTVGFGQMSPHSVAAHAVVTVECFVGLFNLAIMTGLLFARISRPTARVMFSERAVITTFEGVPTLIFRAANRRLNRIVEAEVSVTLLHDWTTKEGAVIRRFETLPVLRSKTPTFILSWQVMHPIDELSPLLGQTAESLMASNAQIIVVLKGLDETFAQTIHARGFYTPEQIVWGGRLVDIFTRDHDGRQMIDYTHFHDIA